MFAKTDSYKLKKKNQNKQKIHNKKNTKLLEGTVNNSRKEKKRIREENMNKNRTFLCVYLSVCLYPINVKTAEPIGPKSFVGPQGRL